MSTVLYCDTDKKANLSAVPNIVVDTLNKLVSELKSVNLPVSLIFDQMSDLTRSNFVKDRLSELALENAPQIKQLGLSKERAYSMLEIEDPTLVVRAANAAEKILTTLYPTEPRPVLSDLDFDLEKEVFFRGDKLNAWYRKQYEVCATGPRQIQALEDAEALFAQMNAFRQKYPKVKLIGKQHSDALISYDPFGSLSLEKIKIKEI